MCMDMRVAKEHSEALLSEAEQHIDEHLNNPLWVREHRTCARVGAEVAMWEVIGNNMLTEIEKQKLRTRYLAAGWSNVDLRELSDVYRSANWAYRFIMRIE